MASNIVFDGTKGISLPSFTTTEKNAIVSPAEGAIVYDTTLNQESLYNGTTWVNVNSSGNSAITSGTAVASTSGTSIDFTSIPSWAKRITVMLRSISSTSTGNFRIRLGYGATPTYVATGYSGGQANIQTLPSYGSAAVTDGIACGFASASANSSGVITIVNQSSNTWCVTGTYSTNDASTMVWVNGAIDMPGVVTALQVIVSTGTFDAGSINVLYE